MKIKILDSGWYSRERDGSQAAVADRAGYDGTSAVTTFEIDFFSIVRNGTANVDDSPVPGLNSNAELNQVTSGNPLYVMKAILAKDLATTGFNNTILYELQRLDRTVGVKLMYPSVTTDTKKSIIEVSGAANKAGVFQGSGKELDASTPYLMGRVKRVTVNDDAKRTNFEITVTFEEE